MEAISQPVEIPMKCQKRASLSHIFSLRPPLVAVAHQPWQEPHYVLYLSDTWLGQRETLNLHHIHYPFHSFLSGTHEEQRYMAQR